MKAGTVAMIGRPNVGKSTLINSIIGTKVAITSPKPQTTRFSIEGLYEDERGQIVFIDTPGIFRKAKDRVSKQINKNTLDSFNDDIDVLLYVVDPTRTRDHEEARVLGIVRKMDVPTILVINKTDEKQKYRPLYAFMEEEFDTVVEVSALEKMHIPNLLDAIYEKLPEKDEKPINADNYAYPAINIDSHTFISELIREKVFLKTRQELPYTTMVTVDEVRHEEEKNLTYIKARIITTDETYKKMLIGSGGRKIKEIGMMARKELETATNKKIFLDLEVVVDRHWPTTFN